MFTRTIALAAALSTAGALSAYAQATTDADVTDSTEVQQDGAVSESMGDVNETDTQVTTDADVTDSTDVAQDGAVEKSGDMIVVGADDANDEEVDSLDDTENRDEAKKTTPDEIMAFAKNGTAINTVDGSPVGTVSSIEDGGEAGSIVYVNLDPAANFQVPAVGIQVKSLQISEEGTALEYAFSLDYLRDRIADAINRG